TVGSDKPAIKPNSAVSGPAWINLSFISWGLATGQRLSAVEVPALIVSEFWPSPDGARLALIGYPGGADTTISALQVYDLAAGTLLWSTTNFTRFAQFSDDGKYLVVGIENDVGVYDATTGHLFKRMPNSGYITHANFSRDKQ